MSGVGETLTGFKDFDIASVTNPEDLMAQVSNMTGSFGDIGTKLSGITEVITSQTGILDGIKEKIASMMSAATEE